MVLFIPKERKQGEGRVGGVPEHVHDCIEAGAEVCVESGAGVAAGFLDRMYRQVRAATVDRLSFIDSMNYCQTSFNPDTSIVLKVKEVLREEMDYLLLEKRPVVGFGHLASNEWLTKTVIARRATYLSLEDVLEQNGVRPILRGMSIVAGEEAIRLAMKHTPGERPEVVIVGYGNVGKAAYRVARDEFGLSITAVDSFTKLITMTNAPQEFRFAYLSNARGGMLSNIIPDMHLKRYPFAHAKPHPLLLVLAPYSPENRAPIVVTTEMLKFFPKNSSIVDVSIDQGGACEFSRITSHENPYVELGNVKYFGIPNIPGAVPGRSAQVFSESVKPYMLQIIRRGFVGALKENKTLRNAVSIYNGSVTSKGLAKTFGLEYTPIETLL